jgi:hypothetical protein
LYTKYRQLDSTDAAAAVEADADSSVTPEVPDSIDNSDILTLGSRLREDLEENKDFVIVSAAVLWGVGYGFTQCCAALRHAMLCCGVPCCVLCCAQ